jgi:hypothetical protein
MKHGEPICEHMNPRKSTTTIKDVSSPHRLEERQPEQHNYKRTLNLERMPNKLCCQLEGGIRYDRPASLRQSFSEKITPVEVRRIFVSYEIAANDLMTSGS